jgi:hypothetical protein
MNHRYSSQEQTERHLRLWLYLLPIVGVIPAIWTLYNNKSNSEADFSTNREQQKASRLSITLLLGWLGSYSLLSFGASQASEILAFRLLYTNALITTGYFIVCIVLMSRLRTGGFRLSDNTIISK